MSTCSRSRSALLGGIFFALFLIAGCAHQTGSKGITDAENRLWSGRISLQIQSEPPQAFFSAFELRGQAERGDLTLTSPIGSILGVLRWSPDDAVLESGGDVKHFASVDALLAQTTGAAVPISALFNWLEGKNISVNGWTADLSRQGVGRIDAKRIDPAPQADLRILLDQ